MHFLVLASDYDGALASDGSARHSTIAAREVESLRQKANPGHGPAIERVVGSLSSH
jgi:hypothetical protein